jgi:uncharacterized membrane protein YeaQ/YmgE (transglycosylase-associated protein family)
MLHSGIELSKIPARFSSYKIPSRNAYICFRPSSAFVTPKEKGQELVSRPDWWSSKLEARFQADRLSSSLIDSKYRDGISGQTLLIILLVGLIAGWLAGQIVQGTGFGVIADIANGVVGALIGSWLLPHLGIHLGTGIVPAIIGATIGAIVLLLILRLVYRRGRW